MLFSLLLLAGMYTLTNPTSAYAGVGVNERCRGDENNDPCDNVEPETRGACMAALDLCNPGLQCFQGNCIDPNQRTQLNCACITEGRAGNQGQNGFKCAPGTDKQAIVNANAPVVYCANPDHGCYNGDGPVDVGFINRTDANHYANDTLRGVRCEVPRQKAICNCVGNGQSGANNFECYKEGEDPNRKTATGFCKNGDAKCVNNTENQGAAIDSAAVWKFTGFIENQSSIITGIKCEPQSTKPSPPPLPPVPPPPCAPGKLTNGICTAFLTGFGEISTDSGSFLIKIFTMLLAISGGLALLLIMRAGYIIMTSAGNGEQVKKGREQLIAAIVGLLFIIFSFVILEVIGVEILRLPEFTGAGGTGGAQQSQLGESCTNHNQCASGVCIDNASGPGGLGGRCKVN